MYQQSLQQDLMQEETKMQEQIYQKLTEFLKDYGKENNLQLVLTYTKGSGVLFANDSLNITEKVIEGLNTLHAKSKETAKVAKDSTAVK